MHLPINKLQMKGTHNSYKLKPLFNLWALGINLMIPNFQYQHDPLRVQLNNDVRHLNRMFTSVILLRILNYHLPELDKRPIAVVFCIVYKQLKRGLTKM